MLAKDILVREMEDHIQLMKKLKTVHLPWVEETANKLFRALKDGKKILIAGNGGSAADSQHFAAELVGRFTTNRQSLSAIALTTDTSAITAIANDYGFEHVFSRQIQGLGQEGDIFIAISTSGNSENLLKAIDEANEKGMFSIALLGKTGGLMKERAERYMVVPSSITQRIQEAHEWILHAWCAVIDAAIEEG